MNLAVIVLNFGPSIEIGAISIHWQTLGLASAVLLMLLTAARIAGRLVVTTYADAFFGVRPGRSWRDALSQTDLILVAFGAIPGAILGARVVYIALHADFYAGSPGSAIDFGQGGLDLVGAVLGGTASGWFVAQRLSAPGGRWLHAAAVPVLLGLGIGKAAMALGGDGQGAPSTVPWATAYAGSGPWGSPSAGVPAHPAQLYEAVLTLAGAWLVVGLLGRGWFIRRDGRAYLAAVALWGVARTVAAFSWQDPLVFGPLGSAQLESLMLAVSAVAAWQVMILREALQLRAYEHWVRVRTRPVQAPTELRPTHGPT